MKENYKWICKTCGVEFKTRRLFKQHYKETQHGKLIKLICEYCGRKFNNTQQLAEHISKFHNLTCEKCGRHFLRIKTFRSGRPHICDECIYKAPHFKNDNELISLRDCSKRTISKILKRKNIGCAICGWNEATCDIHHIIPVKNGGSDFNDNLIIVCPNCHRTIHSPYAKTVYSKEFLLERCISNTFSNWKDYYYPSN